MQTQHVFANVQCFCIFSANWIWFAETILGLQCALAFVKFCYDKELTVNVSSYFVVLFQSH